MWRRWRRPRDRVILFTMTAAAVAPLLAGDIVSIAQCIAIDADVFPYASADFPARSPDDRIWIARKPQESADAGRRPVVGFLAASARQAVLYVPGIAVEPSARRQGVGRALLRACLQSDLARRMGSVVLSVSVVNRPAIALYESEGFRTIGRLPDHYPRRAYGEQRDALTMRFLA